MTIHEISIFAGILISKRGNVITIERNLDLMDIDRFTDKIHPYTARSTFLPTKTKPSSLFESAYSDGLITPEEFTSVSKSVVMSIYTHG